MNALNNQLQDVQRIMVQNIDDVLQRGAVLSGIKLLIVSENLQGIEILIWFFFSQNWIQKHKIYQCCLKNIEKMQLI